MCRLIKKTVLSKALQHSNVWKISDDDIYSILKRIHFFHHINNLHKNVKFTMNKESNGELVFLDFSLK